MLQKINLLSVDPGSTHAGIAIFKNSELVYSEQFDFKAKDSFYNRLRSLKSAVERVASQYSNTDYWSIETPYIGVNPQSGIKVALARGIILAIAFDYDVKIVDISPQETRSYYGVKGNAKKQAYQDIVKLEFQDSVIKGEDEADAIAIGCTAINKIKQANLYKQAN